MIHPPTEPDGVTAHHSGQAAALEGVDNWWRAANYLSAGQIYLRDNPLLRRPLEPGDVKARLLGHWGTTPGLNFIYAHLNRLINESGQQFLFITGPGHGGPANVGEQSDEP